MRLARGESAGFGGSFGFAARATGNGTRGFQEGGDAFGLTWEQFEQFAFEDIDFTIHVGNEEFFGGILQCGRLQGITTSRRAAGEGIGDEFQAGNPFRGERFGGMAMQFGDPFLALLHFAIDSERLRGRCSHFVEETSIGGLVAFSAALVVYIAGEAGDFGVPLRIEYAEFCAGSSKGSIHRASVGDEAVSFRGQCIPGGSELLGLRVTIEGCGDGCADVGNEVNVCVGSKMGRHGADGNRGT